MPGCRALDLKLIAIPPRRMTRHNEKVAICYDKPFAHAYLGPPGYGKSYGDGCNIENVLIRTPYLNVLSHPYCVISESYECGGSHPPELLKSRIPNQSPAEVSALLHNYGSMPQPIPDGVCFTLDNHVESHRGRPRRRWPGIAPGDDARPLGHVGEPLDVTREANRLRRLGLHVSLVTYNECCFQAQSAQRTAHSALSAAVSKVFTLRRGRT